MLGAVTLALGLAGGAVGYRSASVAQPPGTMVIGPSTLVTDSLQNHPTCGQGCTFIQWSGSVADSTYASPVDGTIVAWRIASGSADNKVKLRVLRPAGGGKYSAVASSATVTTSGSQSAPTSSRTSIPVKAGDIIGLDNANSALMFKTGVLGEFPEFWTPPLTNGGGPSAPTPPVGTTVNGYQLQIDAYVQPAPATTTTTTTTTTPTTTTTVNPGTTSLTLSHVGIKASWNNSRLKGKVGFSFTVTGASHVIAELRQGSSIKAKRNILTSRGGTFPETLTLAPRTAPGSYDLRARGDDRQSECGRARKPGRARGSARRSGRQSGDQPGQGRAERGVGQVAAEGALGPLPLPGPAEERQGQDRLAHPEPEVRRRRDQAGLGDDRLIAGLGGPAGPGRWYAVLNVNGVVVKRVAVRIV